MRGSSPRKGPLQLHRGSRRSILHCPNCSTGQPWPRPGFLPLRFIASNMTARCSAAGLQRKLLLMSRCRRAFARLLRFCSQ
jgi:hypothetical protein